MQVSGLNHLTLAVRDLDRSLAFYRDLLGFAVRAVWEEGAYLEAGSFWLCLSLDPEARSAPHPNYSHVAFSVTETDYPVWHAQLVAKTRLWRQNASEGDSTYFLDPDGHKLEIHVGSLATRLQHYRSMRPEGMILYDP